MALHVAECKQPITWEGPLNPGLSAASLKHRSDAFPQQAFPAMPAQHAHQDPNKEAGMRAVNAWQGYLACCMQG